MKRRRSRSGGSAKRSDPVRITRSPDETRSIGEAIGRHLTGGELIALVGELGAGKTHLVQGLARGLGITDSAVTSPTFVFVHEHRGRRPLVHADLFRTERESDLFDVGLFEYFDGVWVVAIEWADRAEHVLPSEHLTIRMAHHGGTARRIEFKAAGAQYRTLLNTVLEDMRRGSAVRAKRAT